jgi:hypothetical protein
MNFERMKKYERAFMATLVVLLMISFTVGTLLVVMMGDNRNVIGAIATINGREISGVEFDKYKSLFQRPMFLGGLCQVASPTGQYSPYADWWSSGQERDEESRDLPEMSDVAQITWGHLILSDEARRAGFKVSVEEARIFITTDSAKPIPQNDNQMPGMSQDGPIFRDLASGSQSPATRMFSASLYDAYFKRPYVSTDRAFFEQVVAECLSVRRYLQHIHRTIPVSQEEILDRWMVENRRFEGEFVTVQPEAFIDAARTDYYRARSRAAALLSALGAGGGGAFTNSTGGPADPLHAFYDKARKADATKFQIPARVRADGVYADPKRLRDNPTAVDEVGRNIVALKGLAAALDTIVEALPGDENARARGQKISAELKSAAHTAAVDWAKDSYEKRRTEFHWGPGERDKWLARIAPLPGEDVVPPAEVPPAEVPAEDAPTEDVPPAKPGAKVLDPNDYKFIKPFDEVAYVVVTEGIDALLADLPQSRLARVHQEVTDLIAAAKKARDEVIAAADASRAERIKIQADYRRFESAFDLYARELTDAIDGWTIQLGNKRETPFTAAEWDTARANRQKELDDKFVSRAETPYRNQLLREERALLVALGDLRGKVTALMAAEAGAPRDALAVELAAFLNDAPLAAAENKLTALNTELKVLEAEYAALDKPAGDKPAEEKPAEEKPPGDGDGDGLQEDPAATPAATPAPSASASPAETPADPNAAKKAELSAKIDAKKGEISDAEAALKAIYDPKDAMPATLPASWRLYRDGVETAVSGVLASSESQRLPIRLRGDQFGRWFGEIRQLLPAAADLGASPALAPVANALSTLFDKHLAFQKERLAPPPEPADAARRAEQAAREEQTRWFFADCFTMSYELMAYRRWVKNEVNAIFDGLGPFDAEKPVLASALRAKVDALKEASVARWAEVTAVTMPPHERAEDADFWADRPTDRALLDKPAVTLAERLLIFAAKVQELAAKANRLRKEHADANDLEGIDLADLSDRFGLRYVRFHALLTYDEVAADEDYAFLAEAPALKDKFADLTTTKLSDEFRPATRGGAFRLRVNETKAAETPEPNTPEFERVREKVEEAYLLREGQRLARAAAADMRLRMQRLGFEEVALLDERDVFHSGPFAQTRDAYQAAGIGEAGSADSAFAALLKLIPAMKSGDISAPFAAPESIDKTGPVYVFRLLEIVQADPARMTTEERDRIRTSIADSKTSWHTRQLSDIVTPKRTEKFVIRRFERTEDEISEGELAQKAATPAAGKPGAGK